MDRMDAILLTVIITLFLTITSGYLIWDNIKDLKQGIRTQCSQTN